MNERRFISWSIQIRSDRGNPALTEDLHGGWTKTKRSFNGIAFAGHITLVTASPDASDPAGKASRFLSSDAELIGDLHSEHAEAELVAEFGGKQFRGAIEHHHDHDDSAHAGHKHE